MSKQVENYVFQEILGQGQYGQVYRGINLKTDETVAIKQMNIEKFKKIPKLYDFIKNEIDILSQIDHPNVIRFIEILRTSNNFYLVYEYCNGGDLERLLKKRKLLPEKEANHILSQILQAFKVLINKNILHRDLKPGNVIFHNNQVKVADFGFCKALEGKEQMTKTMVGSPIYMAPEILKGYNYSVKADIWSIGVVYFEMLFGFCPFEDSTIQRLINQIDQKPLFIPKNVNNVSRGTEDLLRRMLVVEPNRRIEWDQLIELVLNEKGVQNTNNLNLTGKINSQNNSQVTTTPLTPNPSQLTLNTPQTPLILQPAFKSPQIKSDHKIPHQTPQRENIYVKKNTEQEFRENRHLSKDHERNQFGKDNSREHKLENKSELKTENRNIFRTREEDNQVRNNRTTSVGANQQVPRKLTAGQAETEVVKNNYMFQNANKDQEMIYIMLERNRIVFIITLLKQVFEVHQTDQTYKLAFYLTNLAKQFMQKLILKLSSKKIINKEHSQLYRIIQEEDKKLQIFHQFFSKELNNDLPINSKIIQEYIKEFKGNIQEIQDSRQILVLIKQLIDFEDYDGFFKINLGQSCRYEDQKYFKDMNKMSNSDLKRIVFQYN